MTFKNKQRVQDADGNKGTITERYCGPKFAMKGLLRVEWDGGDDWSWENPENLRAVEPSEAAP